MKTLYQPGDGSDQAANRDALGKVVGDRAFTCPAIELNKAFDDAGIQTYFYQLRYRASNEAWPPWMGVMHASDLQVLLLYDKRNASICFLSYTVYIIICCNCLVFVRQLSW